MLNNKKKGFGFGLMPGFNGRKTGSISNGDWDRDGVKNIKDCEPLNFRKQGELHPDYEYLEGEEDGLINKRKWKHHKTGKIVKEKYNERTGRWDIQ